MLLIRSHCTKTVLAWVGPSGCLACSFLPHARSPAGTAAWDLSSPFPVTHSASFAELKKTKTKNNVLSLLWSGSSHTQGRPERKQGRKENLDPKDQNFIPGIQRFLHKRLKKLGPVNTEGVKVQQRTPGPTTGGTLSLAWIKLTRSEHAAGQR